MINIKKINIFGLYFLFFLFALSGFISGSTKHLGAEENEVDGKPEYLPPQPTLIAGDIESLIPLAETNYLDGKPVLLFSGANQARNPASLLEFSNSVVFHQEGFMELALGLFPETGTVTSSNEIHGKAQENSRYRFAMGKEPLALNISQEGHYEVFAKLRKETHSGPAMVTVDSEALIPSGNIPLTHGDITRWQGFARTYLSKGKHTFAVNQAVEELIIVPHEIFQRYIEYAKSALQKRQVSYLFSNNEKAETPVGTETIRAKTTEFVVANPGTYQLWAYVSPVNEEISFRNVGMKLSGPDFMSNAEIIKDTAGNETAIIPLSQHNLDIEEYPNLKIIYELADPARNKLGFILELDTDDDEAVDTLCYAGNMKYELKPFLTVDMTGINLKEKDFWYKVNRELGRTKDTGLHQWYYDAQGSGFSRNIEGNALAVSSDFSKSNHFVITKNFKSINLKENPMVSLDYKLDNPETQRLKINFRIDTDGNGRPDKIIETDYGVESLKTKDGYMRQNINVLSRSEISPNDEKSVCNLVEVILLCSGSGKFYLRSFSIGNQQSIIPEEIKRNISERTKIFNQKRTEDENSWINRRKNKNLVPLNIVLLNGEEKKEKGETVLSINNILQQVQNTLKNTYYCKLKGFIPILYRDRGLPGKVSLWKGNLKETLKGIEFFNYETIEVPRFIAETKTKKEWEQRFEEETLRYGLEKTVYRRDWGNDRYDIEEYAVDEWFGVDNIKDTMITQSEINHWKIQGIQSTFNLTRFLDGIETAFYLDGGKEEAERVLFIPKAVDYQGLDLKEEISFDVSYELSDPDTTELALYLGVDFDGDKKEDATLRLTPSSVDDRDITGTGRKIKVAHFDAKQVLKLYPEKGKPCLSFFLLSVEKKHGHNFLDTESATKKVFFHEVKIKKKRADEDDGVQLVVYADKNGKPLLKSLPNAETLYTLNFSTETPLESSALLKNGWELNAKNTAYRLSYNTEGLNIQGLFYSSGQERYLRFKKYLNGIDLQKYPYMRFPLQVVESDSLDFFVDEFKDGFTIDALCWAINEDGYGITFKESDNSIKRLNELLRVSNFYDIWNKKGKPVNLTEYAYKLISETREYRSRSFSELSEVQQKNILNLNRLIIETTYQQTCPSNLDIIDTNQEKLWIEFRGRCGSNRNFIQRLGGSRFKEDQGYRVNLLKELKKVYPDSNNFTLDDIAVNIDPTLGKFDERLLAYSSDQWTSDKECQIFIKALQIFGVKEKDIGGMLKKTVAREFETPHTIFVNDIAWTSEAIANTQFQHKSFGDEQYIRAHFKDDGLKEEGVILKAVFEQPLELHHIQTLDFDYSLDNPGVQGIVIVPEFDAAYRPSSISFLNLSEKDGHLSCNIAEKIKGASRENESASAKLTSLLFFLVKRPGTNCMENDLTDAYTFSIKNISISTSISTSTVYEQLLSVPLVEFNGKRYSFGDGLKMGNRGVALNKETCEIPITRQGQAMSQFVSSGRMPFCLGNVEVADEDCRIDIYPPSKYLKVEMVEVTKPVSADLKKKISEGHTQDVHAKEPEITFKKINPTRYVVDVKAERPFWLVFSESFHTGWKAYGRKKKEGRRQKMRQRRQVSGNRVQWLEVRGWRVDTGGRK